jgi:hypothetical protein
MTPDDICDRHRNTLIGLSIKVIDADSNLHGADAPLVLIEGSARALNLLAEIFAAVANSENSGSFSISPNGPRNVHFCNSSTHGFYLKRA